MPRFSAHLYYLFTDRPLLQRIDADAAAGFRAIECRFPEAVPADDFKRALKGNKVRALGINTPMGGAREFGFSAVPGRQDDWQKTFADALDFVITIDASAIHCLAGKVDKTEHAKVDAMFVENLKRAAHLVAEKNINLYIEPINPVGMPGYFLNEVEHAADVIAKIDRPNLLL